MYSNLLAALIIGGYLLLLTPPPSYSTQAGNTAVSEAPPPVYLDRGACPFECCTYREWTVKKRTTMLDRPNGNRVIAVLSNGQRVTGLTGEVISKPLAVKAVRDIPDTPIKAGDTFYVLHYAGEGAWQVWFHGKTMAVDEGLVEIPHPRASWWVKIKDSRDRIGWALSQGNFGNQVSCG